MKHKNKIIVLSVFHSLISKNILNTDILQNLIKSGFNIVLLVPTQKEVYFGEQFPDCEVLSYDPKVTISTVREKFLHQMSMLLLDSHYLHYKRVEIFKSDTSFFRKSKHFIRESIVKCFANRAWMPAINKALNKLLCPTSGFERILTEINPEVVFVTDLFNQTDGHLLHAANKLSIPTVAMVRSWDNCLSKGLLRFDAKKFITNNEVLKAELINLHGVNGENVIPVGWPQFDSFINKQPLSRKSFFLQNSLDPNKKLIVFAPAGAILSDTDDDICKILLEAMSKNKLPDDIQFFIRNHPHHPAKFSQDVIQKMHVQTPGKKLVIENDKETEMDAKELLFLQNLMAHADVLVWVATSLCLDALVFDVPEVVVNFDGHKTKDYYSSVKRYHDETHMKKIFDYAPFKVADNQVELIDYINGYLLNPETDTVQREKLRSVQLFKVDGKSCERVTQVLVQSTTRDTSF